jgi:hypothetical protein
MGQELFVVTSKQDVRQRRQLVAASEAMCMDDLRDMDVDIRQCGDGLAAPSRDVRETSSL